MLYVNNEDVLDGALNLAIEEYVLKELDPDESYLMFYSMKPAVIVGRNQNTFEEINLDFVEKNDIQVVRRLSGGGAVYNDEGDLSFSFITKDDGNSFHNYEKFTKPVIEALHRLGVPAKLSGRNDIVVHGKKVSGNAQFATRGRMYSHGTLLFDVNLENVAKALNPDPEKYESKGIKSIRSRVTNIRNYLKRDMTRNEFRDTLLHFIFQGEQPIPQYRLTTRDWEKIRELVQKRYKNWDWNFGRSPKFNVRKAHRFPGGRIDVRLQVERGKIRAVKIYGDFFGIGHVSDVEKRLTGCQYERKALETALGDVDVSYYFGSIEKEEFLHLLY